jgi:hypothetical protein
MFALYHSSVTNKKAGTGLLLLSLALLVMGTTIAAGMLFSVINDTNNGNISVAVSDSPNTFSISAIYDKRKSQKIAEYLQANLNEYISLEFDNDKIVADITSGEKISFSLKAVPGKFKLMLNKKRSIPEAYEKCKQMAEGIKAIIG